MVYSIIAKLRKYSFYVAIEDEKGKVVKATCPECEGGGKI